MRLSTVILPHARWMELRHTWRRAEELGFDAAYTYDHLSWRSFRDLPWFDALTTLSAAAVETSKIRIGTLVTTPNFRHPVPLAKQLLSIDDLSEGRLTIGVGAGGTGFDASALGHEPWSPAERADRFAEFTELLNQLLREPVTTASGRHYSASEVRMIPPALQHPRPPIYVAATGPRGIALAATVGQGWVTFGAPAGSPTSTEESVTKQVELMLGALEEHGRDARHFERVLLDAFGEERPLASVDAFVDWAGRYRAAGITELVVHWPVPDSIFAADQDVFEAVAVHGLAQLGS
jgi:alkanesulfonate monooxygenase SsuD/methylene tetrahydromethanopterin reductase-like flavin-dependent oxidoreductase (luciferase family)